MKEKKQGFFHGAAILALGGVAVKVIGACYKIPLGNLLGPVGMADFSIAYNIYALLFVLSTAGVPAAVSKMVSEASANNDKARMHRIYRVSYLAFAAVGFVGFAVMFFGAEPLSRFMGSESAAISIKAISPAVMFVSLSAINRGYFQGCSNMYPTAVSEIIEALGKFVCGIAAAVCLRAAGFSDSLISAGAISGVSIGAFFSALFFVFCRDGEGATKASSTKATKSIISELLRLAVPITAGAAVISLTNVIDSALVMNLLQNEGFSEYRTKWLYGAYSYATTLFNLPSVLTATLAVSVIPAISAANAKREHKKVNELANSALAISLLFAIPSAFGLFALSFGALYLLYGSSVEVLCIEASALLLRYLCFAIPLLSLVTVTNAIHQAMGSVGVPVFSMIIGALVKIFSNFILIGRADVNILGAAISTVFCYASIASVNIIALKKYRFIELNITKIFIKPLVLGAVTYIAGEWCESLTRNAFGFRFSTLFSVFVGFSACVVTAFLIGAIGFKGKKVVFGGKNISKFLNND